MAPQELAPLLLRLPPILHAAARRPLSGYSKGAQGLSVFPREHSIFTVTTSLRPSLRQELIVTPFMQVGTYPTSYFYLRTVITAAVYRA